MLRFSYSDYVTAWTPRVSNLGTGKKFLSSPKLSDRLWGPLHPPVPWVTGILSRIKLLGREINPSPLFNAKVKNEWSYTSNIPYAFKAWLGKCLSFTRVRKWGALSLICVRVNPYPTAFPYGNAVG